MQVRIILRNSHEIKCATTALHNVPADAKDMRALLLAAHRRRCSIDEKNQAAFRDVIQVLEGHQDTKR